MKKIMMVTTACMISMGLHSALAAVTPQQAALLKTTLTPFGSIRAGSADGLVPAWTGGDTTPAPGAVPGVMPPTPYASDKPIFIVDSSNYTKYEDKLSAGMTAMFKRYPDFRMLVYPSHRPAAAPQWVYDYIAKNAVNAQPAAAGILNGFTNAYGGIPFPIINPDDPNAGAELIWDHDSRWQGVSTYSLIESYVANNGPPVLAVRNTQYLSLPYYTPGGSAETFDGYLIKYKFNWLAPADIDGGAVVQWQKASGGLNDMDTDWEYLSGQGRVREAPELGFDTPSNQADDISNYDEYYVYQGSPAEYNWKYEGMKEMIIPYNNNDMFLKPIDQVVGTHFLNPDNVRFEVHRVYVVVGTLRPGFRNVMAKRVFYLDEDTDSIALADEYDAKGNLYHVELGFFEVRPSLPATFVQANVVYNMLTGQYAYLNVPYSGSDDTSPSEYYDNQHFPLSVFNPQSLAAQEQF